MRIDIKYDLGEPVYLKTDPDQLQGMITGIQIRPNGIVYNISFGVSETAHYEIEFTKEKDTLKAIS